MQRSSCISAFTGLRSIALSLSVLSGCSDPTLSEGRPVGDGGGVETADAQIVGCDAAVDSDGDGIADNVEGTSDQDGDGTPNYRDDDSDADGILDHDEHMGARACSRPDSDGDSVPNWLDTDSDNDGLSDQEEHSLGTNVLERDTDGDGVTDLAEVRGTMTNPTDRSSTIPEGDFFVVLPYMGEHVNRTLRFGTNISRADVYFLIDTTQSMDAPIDNVRTSLTRISRELTTRIRDLQMGVGHFEDFPFNCNSSTLGCAPRLGPRGFYGSPADVPYENRQDITDQLTDVQNALNALTLGSGDDPPESQVEALYQTATGEGGSWMYHDLSYALAPRVCPSIPDQPGPRRGYPCFRPGSLPIIVMVSDVVFHNGTSDSEYVVISPPPHTLPQAASALNAIGARVVGVAVDGGGRADQEAIARMTGTVTASGMPLVYDAAGGEVSDAIIEGIDALVGGTPQDVTTTTENVAGNPGDVDARGFIKSIVPVEGYGTDGIAGARPGVSYTSKDETTFYSVVPGTNVDFAVDFHNDFVRSPSTAQIYRAVIVVVGNGVARLDERQVYIIVPPEGTFILI